MSLNVLLTIAAVLGFVFGLGFLLAPSIVLAPFGIDLDPAGAAMTRFFGNALIALGVIDWFSRGVTERRARRALAAGNLSNFAVAAALAAGTYFAGIGNALGLANAAVHAVIALGFARHVLAGRHAPEAESAGGD